MLCNANLIQKARYHKPDIIELHNVYAYTIDSVLINYIILGVDYSSAMMYDRRIFCSTDKTRFCPQNVLSTTAYIRCLSQYRHVKVNIWQYFVLQFVFSKCYMLVYFMRF